MHQAPTVEFPVGPSRFQAIARRLAWLLVCSVDAVWVYQADHPDWRHGLGLLTTLVAGAVAIRIGRISQMGALHWDGLSWWWSQASGQKTGGEMTLHLDFQTVLLLSFLTHSGARRWIWLEQRSSPSRWTALRRAVHAPPHADARGGAALLPKSSRSAGTHPW